MVSAWELELMTDINLRQFNYDTISDVIMHVRYTAREEGRNKEGVIADLKGKLNTLQKGTKTGFLHLIQPRYISCTFGESTLRRSAYDNNKVNDIP